MCAYCSVARQAEMPANQNLIKTFCTFRYLVMKKILVEIPQRFKRNTCQLMVKKCALRLVNSFWEGCLETVFRTKIRIKVVFKTWSKLKDWCRVFSKGGDGLLQWLALRTTDQGLSSLRPGQVAVRCGIEQVTFIPCLVLVKPKKPLTYN